jgi:hypothetical protein
MRVAAGVSTTLRSRARGRTPSDAVSDVTIKVFLNQAWRTRLPKNHAEIIEQAAAINSLLGNHVRLIIRDGNQVYRAAQTGLDATFIPPPIAGVAEKQKPT